MNLFFNFLLTSDIIFRLFSFSFFFVSHPHLSSIPTETRKYCKFSKRRTQSTGSIFLIPCYEYFLLHFSFLLSFLHLPLSSLSIYSLSPSSPASFSSDANKEKYILVKKYILVNLRIKERGTENSRVFYEHFFLYSSAFNFLFRSFSFSCSFYSSPTSSPISSPKTKNIHYLIRGSKHRK